MTEDMLVALHPFDDDLRRAENILRVGGFAINEVVMRALPHMANAIRIYREIDYAALEIPNPLEET